MKMVILKLSTLVPHTVLLLLLSVHIFAHPAVKEPSANEQREEKVANEEQLDTESSNDVAMVHNDNYDLMAPDYYDQHPAESMQYQNFAEFYDPHMTGSNDLKMEESNQFLVSTPMRAPQPLSHMERRVRQNLEPIDEGRGRKSMLYLMKGSSQPHPVIRQWDMFDYDKHSMNPGNNKMYARGRMYI